MSNIKRIDDFLNLIKDLSLLGYDINKNFVYGNLVMCGVNADSREKIDKHFNYWIKYFEGKKNISVFNSSSSKYFCQFKNENGHVSSYNKVKIYIPLDKEHIKEGAIRIFNFLEMNNINHESKIGSDIRFDDIVIRVDDLKTAEIIKDFVSKDKYIGEGLIKTNPFAFNDSGISFAWDGYLSFNIIVSSLVSEYINCLKERNMLNTVSASSFARFISDKIDRTFLSGVELDKFIQDNNLEDLIYDGSIDYTLVNYMDVMKLILLSIDPSSKMDDFYKAFYTYTSSVHQDSETERISDLRNRLENNDTEDQNKNKNYSKTEDLAFLRACDVWDKIYPLMVNKYGEKGAKTLIDGFIATGNYSYFTRDNDIRNTMIINKIDVVLLKKIIFFGKSKNLQTAALETYNKYGFEQLHSALISATYGDFYRFTNNNHARDNLINGISSDEIYEVVKTTLINSGVSLETDDDIYMIYANFISNMAYVDKTR